MAKLERRPQSQRRYSTLAETGFSSSGSSSNGELIRTTAIVRNACHEYSFHLSQEELVDLVKIACDLSEDARAAILSAASAVSRNG